mgnify:CR=1 FL=1
MCKERCGAPLEPMRSKGSGLPRQKAGSVGSAEKRSAGPFFVSASPRLVSLLCPKVVRYLVYTNMVHCVTDHFFVSASPRLVSLFCPKVVRYMLRIFLTTPQIMTRIRNTIFIQAGLGLRLLLPVRT